MKKLAILTSGGDAPSMNAAVRAVTRYAIYKNYQVYGVERGYNGLINNDIFEMHSRTVSDIVHRGGTILKTARCPEFKEREVIEKGAQNLKNRGISNLIVIGGDGSFRGAKDLYEMCGINVIGIPGTIDNDLAYTDYTLGFDTAVNTCLSAVGNVRDTMTSHDRVLMLEVMGRSCGDIALYTAVAGGAEYVLVPERPFSVDEIAESINASAKRGKTSNLIIIAEGCADKVEEIKKAVNTKTGKNVHYTKLGYIQRGGTPTMQDRVLAAKMSAEAVEQICAGNGGRVIGIKNNQIISVDITDALAQKRDIDEKLYNIAQILSL